MTSNGGATGGVPGGDGDGGVAAAAAAAAATATELTLHTLTEQQRIITGLQEIVGTLKARIVSLEQQQPTVDTDGRLEAVNALEKEKAALHGRIRALSRSKVAAESHSRAQAAVVERLQQTQAEMEAKLADYEAREQEWAKERAVVQTVETRCRHLDLEVQRVRGQLAVAEAQRRQWRALVDLLAARSEPVMQARITVMIENIECSYLAASTGLGRSGVDAAADCTSIFFAAPTGGAGKLRRGACDSAPKPKKSRFLAPL